ncbi:MULTISPECIES: hypothetical protein [Pseudoalteromonas]|uniref:hypothetical protein n=1 Tax=Pseudoalteromonas TaxID=53246 RepID=UPI000299F38F|nr:MULTISPECIES: hypothetical protein [Pseudoalteromonas]AUJ71771.1 hypothetical protein PNC201_17770 [Pseudoalteromonas sp. NC201]MBR8845665.1 hypothetical protein [Pseudoalteromonas sp. JC3]MCF2828705.1 hypothetical protein [Pseudoalteromonas sp. OF5H-5]MCF2833444.1 hypothetical protein [Pseudoalteromonas sp. DL2-H6]MCF2925123.1 hypothetical protein [Pseudoalteromonas sp. DL2-H1]
MTLEEYFNNYYELICNGELDNLAQFYCSNSPLIEANYQQFSGMRQQFKFKLSLQGVELISKQPDLLIVRDSLRFEATIEGNEVVQVSSNVHMMTRDNDEWRIFNSAALPDNKVA